MSAKQRIENLIDVSRETMERLEIYSKLLNKWNPKINLVAKSTLPEQWERHFLDSAQIWPHCPTFAGKWVDIGSGAGFPGLVLALIAKEKAPDLKFTLVESDARKSSFLRTVARETAVSIDIQTTRIESLEFPEFDVVSARALASVDSLLEFSHPILKSDGVCLFLKGKDCANELAVAEKKWRFQSETFTSLTSGEA